jgi:hypothetical protein
MTKMPIRNWHLMEAIIAVLFQFTHVPVIRFKQPRWLYAHAILYILVHSIILSSVVLLPVIRSDKIVIMIMSFLHQAMAVMISPTAGSHAFAKFTASPKKAIGIASA